MDDDIKDILASVSAPSIPQRTRDLQLISRAWTNERTAPGLLPYPTDLVDRIMDRIKLQVRHRLREWLTSPMLTAASADRDDWRDDGYHGSKIELYTRNLANGIGKIQVPCAVILENENSKGTIGRDKS